MRGPLVATLSLCAVVGSASHASAESAPTDGAREPSVSAVSAVDEPLYPPPSASWKVVAAGLGTSAVAYGAAAGVSYLYPDAPGASDLRVPFAGPWMAIAHNGCRDDEPDCSKALVVLRTIVTAIDGVAQASGIAVALEGIFMRTQQPRAPATSPVSAPKSPSGPSTAPPSDEKGKNLFFLPMPITIGARAVGVGVVGRF